MKKCLRAAIAVLLVLSVGWILASCTTGATETGFRIDTDEMKLTVEKGTEVDFSKLKVEAVFDDDSAKALAEGKDGYSLDKGNYSKDTAGSYTITVRYKEYDSKSFLVTVRDPASPTAPTVTGIEVKTEPTKKEYFVGEDFDKAGLAVEKVMSDGTKIALTEADYTIDIADYKKDVVGTYTITVKLNADPTKTDTFTVTVNAAVVPVTVTGIEVKSEPTKKEYFVGEDFDKAGLAVEKVMSDGTKIALTEADYTIDIADYKKDVVGTYTITVKLNADPTKTDTFTVTVISAPAAYRIKTMPRTAFLAGESFDAFGLEVEKAENGVTETLLPSEYEIDFSNFDATAAGRYEIRIVPIETASAAPQNARGASPVAQNALKYTVSVSAVELDLANVKTHYREGEELDTEGLAISYVDEDGIRTPLAADEYEIDADSFYPWVNVSREQRIYIRLVKFPDFRLYYSYDVNYAPLSADPVIDYSRSSTIVPFGYQYDPNAQDRLSIRWTSINSYGKDFGGGYDWGSGQDEDFLKVECDKTFDTTVPGIYMFTFKEKIDMRDPFRSFGPVSVTVLEEGAAYATRIFTEQSVRVKYGQPFDPSAVVVQIEMSDGTTLQRSLDDGFVWTRRSDTIDYCLKNAYRTKENERDLQGSFRIEWDTSEVVDPVFEGIEISGGSEKRVLATEQNGEFTAVLYRNGECEIRPSYVKDPGYKLKITSINGTEPEDPCSNCFEFRGVMTTIKFEIFETVDDGQGSFTGTVVKSGTLTVSLGLELQEASKFVEVEVAGKKQQIEYDYGEHTNYTMIAYSKYEFDKGDIAIPVRFTLKNTEKYILTYWNQTDRYGVSKIETIYYYEQSKNGKGGIQYSVYSKETGAEVLQGTIEFALCSQIVSIAYDGFDATNVDQIFVDFGKETPSFSLSKLNVSVNDGFSYRLFDGKNIIANDRQFEQAIFIERGIMISIVDETGVEWEWKYLYFNFNGSSNFEGYYLKEDENSPRIGRTELYADGKPFNRESYRTAEELLAIRWSVVDGQEEIAVAKGEFFDRDGNAVDLASFDPMSAILTVRVGYTVYGMIREWNSETQANDVRFEETTLYVSTAASFTALTELPEVYVDVVGLKPIPKDANFAMDLSWFDISIEVFRSAKVTADGFEARYKEEVRDEMTMKVESNGTDRFLAKFFRSGKLVTYLNVIITRDGVIDDKTRADFTYQTLTSDQINFIRFTNNEAYVSAEKGAILNVDALNRWAAIEISAENPEAIYVVNTGTGSNQCLFQSADNFNLTVTVTATDGVAKQIYLLHVVVRPETPFFEMRVNKTTYTALLSEMFQGTDGDFYTDPIAYMAFLTAPLKTSELGEAYDATAKTLKVTFTADGRFCSVNASGGSGESVESGAELTMPLFDPAEVGFEMNNYPQYAGAMCGGAFYLSKEGEQQVPIMIFVLPNA